MAREGAACLSAAGARYVVTGWHKPFPMHRRGTLRYIMYTQVRNVELEAACIPIPSHFTHVTPNNAFGKIVSFVLRDGMAEERQDDIVE